jgi:LacI family transcriptional regulator
MTDKDKNSGGEGQRGTIEALERQLQYAPEAMPRIEGARRGNVIAVFINHFQSVVMHELIGAISVSARRAGMEMLVYDAPESFSKEGLSPLAASVRDLCAGMLVVMPRLAQGGIEMLEAQQIPTVLVNYWATETTLPVVRGDNRNGARSAVSYLLAQGHRRIAFIRGLHHTGQSHQRELGYEDALRTYQIEVDPALVIDGDFLQVSGFRAARQLLALADPPTAIFAANDDMAFGAMDAVRSHGLRVPNDMSVIGFDDIMASAYAYPSLSSLRQPLAQIGERAVMELLRRINDGALEAAKVEFPTELMLRDSSGPAAPRRRS